MDTVVIAILVFVAVMVIAALVFGGWLLVSVVRLIYRAIGSLAGWDRSQLPPPAPHTVRCGFEKCRAVNPDRARFCRRCGKMLGAGQHHAHVRPVAPRAAVW